MVRIVVYGALGFILGALAGLVIVGTWLPGGTTVGFVVFFTAAVIGAFLGGFFGHWFNTRDAGLAKVSSPKTVYGVAAIIGLIISACYFPLVFVYILFFASIPSTLLNSIVQSVFSPLSIGLSTLFYILLSIFATWIGVRYVAKKHILDAAYAPKDIVRWTFTAKFGGVFFVWQTILGAFTQNFSILILGLAVGFVSMYVAQYFEEYFIKKVQKELPQSDPLQVQV